MPAAFCIERLRCSVGTGRSGAMPPGEFSACVGLPTPKPPPAAPAPSLALGAFGLRSLVRVRVRVRVG